MNTISVTVDDPNIEYVYSVNEVDHFAALRHLSEASTDDEGSPVVSPAARRRLRLTGQISYDKLRDSIFCTKETEKNSGLYKLHRPKDGIQLTITDGEPTDQRGPYATGAFGGLAFQTDFEPGEDGLSIEVNVPTRHLEELASALKAGEVNALHVALAVQSFSYEVDDALREWYHPRDLFLHGGAAPAAVLTLRAIRREPKETPQPSSTDDDIGSESQLTTPAFQPPQASAPDYSGVLKGIKIVLWVIALILLFQLAK